LKELQSLGLAIEVINEEEKPAFTVETAKVPKLEAALEVGEGSTESEESKGELIPAEEAPKLEIEKAINHSDDQSNIDVNRLKLLGLV